jgi:hypothetical protein
LISRLTNAIRELLVGELLLTFIDWGLSTFPLTVIYCISTPASRVRTCACP